jgi:hypothetical protein
VNRALAAHVAVSRQRVTMIEFLLINVDARPGTENPDCDQPVIWVLTAGAICVFFVWRSVVRRIENRAPSRWTTSHRPHSSPSRGWVIRITGRRPAA